MEVGAVAKCHHKVLSDNVFLVDEGKEHFRRQLNLVHDENADAIGPGLADLHS